MPQYNGNAGRALSLPGITAFVFVIALLLMTSLVGCRAQEPWPLWEAYSKGFIDGQGRVIDRSAPGTQKDRTTSEGQAYAMFFALVDNDKPHFEHLLSWTEANLAEGDLTLHLPAWDWGKDDRGAWTVLDRNSAADADLWLAYTLLEAGRLWHDPRYSRLGGVIATRIAREEVVLVPGLGTTLLPGPQGFHPDEQTWLLNPSYLPPPVLAYLAKIQPQGPWLSVLESLGPLLDEQMDHGFAMDWVSAGTAGVHPAAPPAQPSSGLREPLAAGSYDAIRVYLWLGLSAPGAPGVRDLSQQLGGMAGYMRTALTPPLEVDGSGTVLHADAPVGFSAAMIPFLQAEGMKAQAHAQADRLVAAQVPESGLYGRPENYYEQNLALFSTGYSEGKFRFERDGKLHVKWK